MSKKESEGIIKLYIDIFGRIDSDWKSMLSPIVVDIEELAPAEVTHARLYNTIFWCIFGVLALSTVVFCFPNVWKMIIGPIPNIPPVPPVPERNSRRAAPATVWHKQGLPLGA